MLKPVSFQRTKQTFNLTLEFFLGLRVREMEGEEGKAEGSVSVAGEIEVMLVD
jgi:hypothetical protein